MAVDMFMRIEGASGESKDANHKEWTDILSFSWGATQPGSMATGGGGGSGKASFNDLHVVARIDKAAPAVMKHCAGGKHLSKVELSICKAGGTQIEYSKITLDDVMVTSVQLSGDNTATSADPEYVLVNYAFQASKVTQQYWEQTDKGGKGAESQVAWDIKQNKEA
ncbi:Hcp1 family type VI secretion system effector [Bordetella genomosp. 10]|uniref:Hcp1 family type VI secretion system effector n=1 Tax=Bordetella genomosp. 10 TaxID=1416804 RepID=A0A261SIT5_9BORD|nr:type VI secretion system tube protein Hcp [Bordetella genomosp. 10]OZI37314.1 Hcp1 family type VI secretion system effector [Bordetella genomosp. 10]